MQAAVVSGGLTPERTPRHGTPYFNGPYSDLHELTALQHILALLTQI
jgi:hypothetical protein